MALSEADIGRAREILGYSPAVGFTEGLRRTIVWISEASFAPTRD